MLGHAITTELQLLAARARAADLAGAFPKSRVEDSARDDLHSGGVRPNRPGTTSGRGLRLVTGLSQAPRVGVQPAARTATEEQASA